MRRALVALALVVLLAAVAAVGVGVHLVQQVDRVPGAFPAGPRDGGADGSVDVLVVGSRHRGPGAATWLPGHRRPLSLMVVHLDADRRGAAVVALPLGARVPVPGHGRQSLDAVFRLGGPALTVRTVERLSGSGLDHLAVVDWAAFARLTDRLGGLQLGVDPGEIGAAAGPSPYVAGDDVLDFVEQPGVGPVARLHRQLVLLDEVMRGSLHRSMHESPLLVYRFLDVLTSGTAVDEDWSVVAMARLTASLWSLRSARIRYVTAPLTRVGGTVRLDRAAGPEFWRAVREDRLDGWLTGHRLRGLANRQRVDL